MNDLIFFFLGCGLIINITIGLAFMYSLYENDFTIIKGVKALLFSPVWFLFLDEMKKKLKEGK